jgi:8-oxo-dGTP pyrophosphatase MutT (NUDIX family)
VGKRGGGRGPVERAVSAGGVVFRRDQGKTAIVICGRNSDGVWGLPKGTPEADETLEETALREVREETGLEVRIVDKVGVVEYWFARSGTRYHKWVHHYLMEAIGGDTNNHDVEYDRVEWRDSRAALRRLTFKNEADMLAKALKMIEAKG